MCCINTNVYCKVKCANNTNPYSRFSTVNNCNGDFLSVKDHWLICDLICCLSSIQDGREEMADEHDKDKKHPLISGKFPN